MANLWQKTLFYLGLVDEEERGYEAGTAPAPAGGVGYRREARTAEPAAGLPAAYPEPVAARVVSGSRRVEPPASRPSPGGRRVEPPQAPRRRPSTEGALAEAGVIGDSGEYSAVRTVTDQDLETQIITARSYADAQLLADHIRANSPVVLDLRKVEPAMVRRLVDFASGLTYALGGSMRKIGQGVILVTPANVNVGRDERRRLQSLGYLQASEGI
ncbi:MAG: cell division protein SepF [Acidimicrobiia bacterium]|jgi:FtsZ-interacting cell division protein YlmF|nr:cell division protein SepF [Acidimicrobiia bacterium]